MDSYCVDNGIGLQLLLIRLVLLQNILFIHKQKA